MNEYWYIMWCVSGILFGTGTAVSMIIASCFYFSNKWDPNRNYLEKLGLETKFIEAKNMSIKLKYDHEQMQHIIKNHHEQKLLNGEKL